MKNKLLSQILASLKKNPHMFLRFNRYFGFPIVLKMDFLFIRCRGRRLGRGLIACGAFFLELENKSPGCWLMIKRGI